MVVYIDHQIQSAWSRSTNTEATEVVVRHESLNLESCIFTIHLFSNTGYVL